MSAPILYCGDTELGGAASYLAGLMTAWGWSFDYVPSDTVLTEAQVEPGRSLYILSDYPATRIDRDLQQRIVSHVAAGAGLLMIGGWESFHGLGGDWNGTPIAEILPVIMLGEDDRVNSSSPALLVEGQPHPATSGLSWTWNPPTVGGWNRVTARDTATVALEICQFHEVRLSEDRSLHASLRESFPGLVLGKYGRGRTAAFLSDIAPHWVGGFVDWGHTRVTAQAAGAPAIEVGNWYAQFWRQLVAWTMRPSS